MNTQRGMLSLKNSLSRRQMLAGIAAGFGGLSVYSHGWAQAASATENKAGASAPVDARTSIHQEIALNATVQRIYKVLLDSKLFAAFTGMPADIDVRAGGALSMFAGMIVGRNIELIPNQRIVQAWRPTSWEPGVYSVVKFELRRSDATAVVVLDHTGFPAGNFDHLDPGWKLRYWDPLKKFLAQASR